MDWSTIVAISPALASSFELAQRLLGFSQISIALASILVLKRHYRNDQHWALLFIFTIKMPVWLPALFLIPSAIQIAFWGTIALSTMWILGIVIGVRETLQSRKEKQL